MNYYTLHFVYLSSLLKEKHKKFYEELTMLLDELKIHWGILYDTKDIWCRDYMPVQVDADEFVQFEFNPDYLSAKKYWNLKTNTESANASALIKPVYSDLRVDGGNIVRFKNKVIVTNKIFAENNSIQEYEVRSELRRRLNADEIISIPVEPCDVIGHADGMVKFIDENTVLMNDYSICIPSFHAELMNIFSAHNLKVELMPYKIFDTVNKDQIPSAKGNYINYLQLGNIILFPKYGIAEDETALNKIHSVFPLATIRTIDCNSIANEGGVLNCITWDVKYSAFVNS